jgi:hypothetical protein
MMPVGKGAREGQGHRWVASRLEILIASFAAVQKFGGNLMPMIRRF